MLAALAERQRVANEKAKPKVMSDEETADFFGGLVAVTQKAEARRA